MVKVGRPPHNDHSRKQLLPMTPSVNVLQNKSRSLGSCPPKRSPPKNRARAPHHNIEYIGVIIDPYRDVPTTQIRVTRTL